MLNSPLPLIITWIIFSKMHAKDTNSLSRRDSFGDNICTLKIYSMFCPSTLHWRHNDHDGISNHQSHGCLLNRLFRRRSKKTSKLRVTDLCVGNSPGPVNSPHKGPVARKMFPFDDVIMNCRTRCAILGHDLMTLSRRRARIGSLCLNHQ